MFKNAWWLVKKEMKYNWYSFAFTLLTTILAAFLFSILLEQSVRDMFGEENIFYNYFGLDALFIAFTPCLAALFMSGPYLSLRTIKEDPFSKRMAFYRSLPIPVQTLTLSRTMLMLVTLIIMSTGFYATIFIALSENFYLHVTQKEFFIFVLIWFGYSLALGGMNTYVEFGTSGKILYIVPFVFVSLTIMLLAVFHQVSGQSIVEWSIIIVKNYTWYAAIVSLAIGVFGCYVWNRLLLQRLLNRDYV